MPRLWSTAWSLGLTSSSQATSTRKLYLQHLDSFYRYCDERFGADAFDEGMSTRDAEGVMLMVESFYLTTTSDPAYNTTDVQRWGVVRAFVQSLAKRLAPSNPEWAAAASMLAAMGRMRAPRLGGFRFIRALPKTTLLDLLEVAHPSSPRNPFKGYQTRVRNWLIVNLMLLAGLRRGEALLLACDSLKEDVDPESGEVVRWLDITTVFENDPRSTTPRIKTLESHRQIPVSEDLALLYQHHTTLTTGMPAKANADIMCVQRSSSKRAGNSHKLPQASATPIQASSSACLRPHTSANTAHNNTPTALAPKLNC